jgi:hypothetical protein
MSDKKVICGAAGEVGCVDHCGHSTEHIKNERCSAPCGNRRIRVDKDDGICSHVNEKPVQEETEKC